MSEDQRPQTFSQGVQLLAKTVVDGGYCVGCGACAALPGSPLQITLDDYGMYRAQPAPGSVDNTELDVRNVCPFSEQSVDEDELARPLFASHSSFHPRIGYHAANYVGYAVEGEFRERGSSGGMVTWLLADLLRRGEIDAVIHVQPTKNTGDGLLFHYDVSTSLERLFRGSKSRYHPIEMSQVMKLVREQPGRYAFVGIPCFVKAMRLLMRHDPTIAKRVTLTLALVCGHLKSTRFAQFLAWQAGVHPNAIGSIDFRHKIPGRPASDYGVRVCREDGPPQSDVVERVYGMYGTDWGQGFFKYKACDFCDDVLGETADVTFGDAWLPGYERDPKGTNIVVVRHLEIKRVLEQAVEEDKIWLQPVSADTIARSQRAGLSHRREGLAYRLYLADRAGSWRPPKRVKVRSFRFRPVFAAIQRMRMKLASDSHRAFEAALQANRFEEFKSRMARRTGQYRRLLNFRDMLRMLPLRRRIGPQAIKRWLRSR